MALQMSILGHSQLILLYMSVCSVLLCAALCKCTTVDVNVYHCRYSYILL